MDLGIGRGNGDIVDGLGGLGRLGYLDLSDIRELCQNVDAIGVLLKLKTEAKSSCLWNEKLIGLL